jgi:hypothetical protein
MGVRVAVRWLGLYLLLYALPWLPGGGAVHAAIRTLTLWVIHTVADPSYSPPELTGSGDTLLDWFQVPVVLTLSGVGATAWSIVVRLRGDDRVVRWLIWVGCRYYLAMVMVSYGMAKVVRGQFSDLSLTRLMSTYGDSSPMGLLWTFMGHSAAYSILTGIAEIAGGLLLLSRRTTTLGALILIGALTNVVAMNLAYDVPVKLFSSHLLLIAVGVAAADWRRLLAVFASCRAVPPRDLTPPLAGPRARLGMKLVRACAVFYILFFFMALRLVKSPPVPAPAPPTIYGIHDVERSARGPASWTRVVIERDTFLTVWTERGEKIAYGYSLDDDLLHIRSRDQEGIRYTFRIKRSARGELELHGEGTTIRLRLRDPRALLLNSRGFHWVSEYPFNR